MDRRRTFNWKLAIVFLLTLIALSATAVCLRQWQVGRLQRRTAAALGASLEAYEQSRWEQAAELLSDYLAFNRADAEIWLKLADSHLNIRPLASENLNQAAAACRTVLRAEKTNSAAATKLLSLFLEMDVPAEAQLIAENFLHEKNDPAVRRLLAVSLARQRKFTEAQTHLTMITKDYPSDIDAYDTLGRLYEQHFPEADPLVPYDQAVVSNPSSALALIARADFHIRNNDNQKAISDLTAAETLDLSEPLVRLRLARCFLQARLDEKASDHLKAVKAADSTIPLLWQLWAQLAAQSDSIDEMVQVADSGLRALGSQPWDFMPVAAELYIRAGRLTEAADCMTQLKKKGVAPLAVLHLEGLLSESRGQDYDAIDRWCKARNSGYKSNQMELSLAAAYERVGDMRSAISLLRQVTSEQPTFLPALYELSRMLGKAGDWKGAAQYLNTAVKLAPGDSQLKLDLLTAKVKTAAARQASAEEWAAMEKQASGLETDAGKTPLSLLRFEIALHRRDLAAASDLLDQISDSPDSLQVRIAQAELLTCRGENQAAIDLLRSAVSDFPDEIVPLRYLSVLLQAKQEPDQCQALLEEAVRTARPGPHKRDFVLLLADFYRGRDEHEKAGSLLTDASADLPSDLPLQRALLDYLVSTRDPRDLDRAQAIVDRLKTVEGPHGWQWRWEQARLWAGRQDSKNYHEKAIAMLRENLQSDPADTDSLVLIAGIYDAAGQPQMAITAYRQAIDMDPSDMEALVGGINNLSAAGRHREADELLNRAIKENPGDAMLRLLELQRCLRLGNLSAAESILSDINAARKNNDLDLPLAMIQLRQKKFDQAALLLDKLRLLDPNSVPVTAALVELNILNKMDAKALELCDEMVERLSTADSYVLRAETSAMLGHTEQAGRDFDRAIAIEPANARAWMRRSAFHAACGSMAAALADIEKASTLAPADISIRKQTLSLLFASGTNADVERAVGLMDHLLAEYPYDKELKLYKARHLIRQGNVPAFEQAEQILSRITAAEPEDAAAWSLRIQASLDQGRFGDAVELALQGLAHSPENRTLLLLKARAEAVSSPSIAIPVLESLHEQNPADIDVAIQLAGAYTATNQPEKALQLLTNLVASCAPQHKRRAEIALAQSFYRNNMPQRAMAAFDNLYKSYPADSDIITGECGVLLEISRTDLLRQRIELWSQRNPDDTTTLLLIAGTLAESRDTAACETAIELLNRILTRDSGFLKARQVLAMLLQSIGRNDEAARLYTQILEVEKDNLVVINNLAWILCEAQHSYSDALELAAAGLSKAPDYIDLLDTCGVIYYRLGEHDRAVTSLNRCVRMYPENSQAMVASRFHLARALAALGQSDGAVRNLQLSLDMHDKFGGLSMGDLAEADDLKRALLEAQKNVTITK